MKAMRPEGVSASGMTSFDQATCSKALGEHGHYICMVSLAAFSVFEFNYDKNPPTPGSIVRVREQVVPFVTSGKLTYDKAWQVQPLPVRVASVHGPILGKIVRN